MLDVDLLNRWVWHKVEKQPVFVYDITSGAIYWESVEGGDYISGTDTDIENFIPIQVEELQY